MANNKVALANGTVLIDLTGDTVDAEHLMQGYTAHDKSGAAIVGTATGGSWPPSPIVAGDTPVIVSDSTGDGVAYRNMTRTDVKITITKAGTYRFKFTSFKSSTSSSGFTAQLYKNGAAISGATASWGTLIGDYEGSHAANAGDYFEVWLKSGSTSYGCCCGPLIACIDGDNGF